MKTKHASVEDVLKIKGKSVIFHTDFTVTDESHIERLKKVLNHLILKNKITIIVAKGGMGSYLDQYSRHDYKLIQCSTLQHVIQYFARMQNSMDHIIVANNVVKSMLGRRRFGGLMYVDIGDEIDIPRALPIVKSKEVVSTHQYQLTTSIESNRPHKSLKYVFVIPSYNNEPYYRKNLDSVVLQTYTNWRIIYVDDASTDRTYELVQKYIQEKGIKDKVKLIRNDKNYKQAYSRYVALKECDDDEICCFVDGDDWLYDTRVLEKTNQIYMKGNVELTYGGMHKFIDGKTGTKCVSKSFSSDVIKNNSYRKQPWSVLHLRTGYARLFKNAPEDYYKDHNGDWLKCSTDMALMWWGLEQCNGRFKNVDFSSYVYNVDASVRFENSYERKNKSKEWIEYRGKVTRRLIQYENPLCIVKQICISPSLKQFDRIKVKYSFVDYNSHSKDCCLFFGVYTKQELNNVKRYNGKAYIMFGGSDTDERIPQSKVILNELLQTQSKYRFVAISKNIESILIQKGFKNVIYQPINLVDTKLFKNGHYDKNSNNIYVYDGTGKIYDGKKVIYNHKLIDELHRELPEYIFLRSSEMNVAYEKMPDVYGKCFIALRLTKQDGNANTVQECEAIGMPVVHNHSEYGLKWKSKEDIKKIIKYNKSNKIHTLNNFTCINIENNMSYEELISNTNGDNINETNFINNIIKNNITLYYNNKFITGNNKLLPQITVSRNKTYDKLINKQNVFLSSIPYRKECRGLYFITKSMIDAIKDKTSLLYPHVYDKELYGEIKYKNVFLHEQSIDKNWYNWMSDNEIQKLKLNYFPEDAFVICICGRIAINNYPKSLLEAIKLLRQQGHNIHLLALTKFEVNPYRLTQKLYDEITSYDWVKSFTVNKKEVLNYFRMCDLLASTYRDYCNHVGGSNKIKEYLLCDKPILCSRGKERERELGKNYPGFYDCETCNTVPPLCWTQEFIRNPHCYQKQYNKHFYNIDNTGGNKSEITHIVNIIEMVQIYIYTTNKKGFLKTNCHFMNEINILENSIDIKKLYIIDKIDKHSILFLEKLGKNGICAIANYVLPNCIPYRDIPHIFNKQIKFVKSLNKNDLVTSRIKRLFTNNCNKVNKPVTLIPMYGRHEITRTVIRLLQKQTIDTDIILGVSTQDDLKFAVDLNIDHVYTDNQPLSNKYQVLLLYAKTYHSKYVYTVGSDDISTLDYIKVCIDIFNNNNYDTVETRVMIMIQHNCLYKVTLKDQTKSCGAGRMFNSDALDRINWFLFPIDMRSSIDSNVNIIMTNNNFKRKILNDIDNTIILLKRDDEQKMTSSLSIINNDDHIIEKIFLPNYLALTLYVNNLNNIYKCLTNTFKKDIVYITDLNKENLKTHYISRLQTPIVQLLKHRADICDIRYIENNKSIDKYEKYILDGSCLDPETVRLTPNKLKKILLTIRKHKKIMLMHDTHEWSFGFNTKTYIPPFVPCLYDTPEKQLLKQTIIENNIKTIVAIDDNPEVKFLRNYLGDSIDSFKTIFHFIDTSSFNIFQFNRTLTKNVDILFYGTANPDVYPFRCRIKDICLKYGLNIKIIPRKYTYDPDICDNGLAKHISKSWLSIACTSNFKCSARKYNEIALSGSVPMGDINKQLYNLNGGNMIILDDNMSDEELKNEIYNYINLSLIHI